MGAEPSRRLEGRPPWRTISLAVTRPRGHHALEHKPAGKDLERCQGWDRGLTLFFSSFSLSNVALSSSFTTVGSPGSTHSARERLAVHSGRPYSWPHASPGPSKSSAGRPRAHGKARVEAGRGLGRKRHGGLRTQTPTTQNASAHVLPRAPMSHPQCPHPAWSAV